MNLEREKIIDDYLEFLKYQKNYSDYTIKSYENDIMSIYNRRVKILNQKTPEEESPIYEPLDRQTADCYPAFCPPAPAEPRRFRPPAQLASRQVARAMTPGSMSLRRGLPFRVDRLSRVGLAKRP